jgi:acetyl-CoA C-acetyltransferase
LREVFVTGVGETPCRPIFAGKDFREMLFEAASEAFADAGISSAEVDGVVSSGFDFYEGISITDSYTPDQVGGRLKFNTLVSNDSLNAFIHGCMLVASGRLENVVISAYAKPSNIQNYGEVVLNMLDPHTVRPLLPHYHVLAALDAHAYLIKHNADSTLLSMVTVKNMENALRNPSAAYAAKTTVEEVEKSGDVAEPLKKMHIAGLCDYAAAVIISSNRRNAKAVVKGFGYAYGGYSSDLALRVWGSFQWAGAAAKKALKQSGLRCVDFAEISEPYAHTELMVLDELGLLGEPVERALESGELGFSGGFPVNPSGGCIGMGYPLNAAGLQRVVQSVKLLSTGRWRTCLTASPDGEIVDAGAVVVLSGEV